MAVETDDRQRVRAQAKWVRTSARKARLVLDHIRGRSVPRRGRSSPSRRALPPRTSTRCSARRSRTRRRTTARRRRAPRRGRVRRRGTDAEALEAARARPGQPDSQAHVPRDARPRGAAGDGASASRAKTEAASKRSSRTEEDSPPEAESSRRRRRRRWPDGPEGASRRVPRRRHPRLEVELVDGPAGVRDYLLEDVKIRVTSSASSRTRGSPTSSSARTSSGSPWTSTRRAPASSSASPASRSTRCAATCTR